MCGRLSIPFAATACPQCVKRERTRADEYDKEQTTDHRQVCSRLMQHTEEAVPGQRFKRETQYLMAEKDGNLGGEKCHYNYSQKRNNSQPGEQPE